MDRLIRRFIWIVAALFTSTGCHGGGGEPEPDYLTVALVFPADGSSSVQTEVTIEVTFDGPLAPSTLSTQTFLVTAVEGDTVEGAVTQGAANAVATFAPDEPLELSTQYQVTLTTAIQDTSGRALEKDFAWRFRTVDPGWGDAEDISGTLSGDAQGPRIAVDGFSDALAVWLTDDGLRRNLTANRYTRAELWGSPVAIEETDDDVTDFDLAMNLEGDAVVVWEQASEGRESIWASRFTAETGWGTPTRIEADEADAGGLVTTPRVAIDANGNAAALWYQSALEGAGNNVWSSRRTDEGGWETPEIIDSQPPRFAEPHIDVEFDADGNAVAIWTRWLSPIDPENDLWANRYTLTEGWGTAERIDSLNSSVGDPVLTVTPGGEAHALWLQNDGSGVRRLWTSRYSAGAWTANEPFTELDDPPRTPQIDSGPDGTVYAVWAQSDGTVDNIWARMYTDAEGWAAPLLIEQPLPDDDPTAAFPRLSVGPDGNVFAIWQATTRGLPDIWSNNFEVGIGWGEAELIQGSARLPQIAAAPGRRAHGIWQARTPQGQIVQTRRFE